MQFGVTLPQFGPRARDPEVRMRIREVATAGEELGYDVLWTAEHMIFPRRIRTPYPYGDGLPFDVSDPILDVTATLAYVAAFTSRVRLGTSVLVLPYHHPIALAKALASVDVLSGGRLLVGIAGGWLREEFELLGVPFHERGVRTDEYIDLMKCLWDDDPVRFDGRFFQLDDAAFFPKPLQRPHPPIWVGGDSDAALRRVARCSDGWMAVPRDLDALAGGIAKIHSAAEAAGRDPAHIGVATGGGAASVGQLLDLLPRLQGLGVTIVNVPALFWAPDVAQAIDLLETFAQRAGLRADGNSPETNA